MSFHRMGDKKMEKLKIGFIGAGTVGTALAVRLSRRGYDIAAVSSRSLSSAQRDRKSVV